MNWSNTWAAQTEATQQSNPNQNPLDALNQDQLLMKHKKLQDDLASLKAEELELRKYIVNRAFPSKTEGTNTLELGAGYELKAVVKYNYKLADNEIVQKTLQLVAEISNEGSFIADRLVSWTPNFQKHEYNKLLDDAASGSEQSKKIIKLIGMMLTITDAAPTLSIKEPKSK